MIRNGFWIALLLCLLTCCSTAYGQRKSFEFKNATQAIANWDYIVNYPIKDMQDVVNLRNCFVLQLERIRGAETHNISSGWEERFSMYAAVTDPKTSPGERVEFVDFATSDKPVMKILRDEIKIPPPPGGMLVRYYSDVDKASEGVREIFYGRHQSPAGGVALPCRFILINLQSKHGQKTLDHELAHAYLHSSRGADSDVPRWFNEGQADYLAGVSRDYSDADIYGGLYYDAWLRFQFLQCKLGKKGTRKLIHDVYTNGNFDSVLTDALGAEAYSNLRNKNWYYFESREYESISIWKIVLLIVGIGIPVAIFAKAVKFAFIDNRAEE